MSRIGKLPVAIPSGVTASLSDDAFTVNFLHFIVAIGNNPVPIEQAHGFVTGVLYGDGIGESKALLRQIRLLFQEFSFYGNFYGCAL